jgi:hypothetical protein
MSLSTQFEKLPMNSVRDEFKDVKTSIPFVNKVTYRGMIKGTGEETHNDLFDGSDMDSVFLYSTLFPQGNLDAIAARLHRIYFEVIHDRTGEKLVACETNHGFDDAPVHEWGLLGYNTPENGDHLHFVTEIDEHDNRKLRVTVPESLYRTFFGNHAVDKGRVHRDLLVRYEVTLGVAWRYYPEKEETE